MSALCLLLLATVQAGHPGHCKGKTTNRGAFAALTPTGSIECWGSATYGGGGAPTGTGFVTLWSTEQAFAALDSAGSISVWGNTGYGGSGAPSGTGFTAIYSTQRAFVAIDSTGAPTAWGGADARLNSRPCVAHVYCEIH